MANQKVDLIRKIYSKTEYPKIIDTKFSQLGVVSLNEQIDNTVTVSQFFEYYNELALRKEITQLRRDLLQAQIEKAEALSGEKIDIDINSIDDASIAGDDFANISNEINSSPSINTINTAPV